MDFSEALKHLKNGKKLSRTGWNGKEMYVYFVEPGTQGNLPYLELNTVDDKRLPWFASQTDLLSDDWVFYEEKASVVPLNLEDLISLNAKSGGYLTISYQGHTRDALMIIAVSSSVFEDCKLHFLLTGNSLKLTSPEWVDRFGQ